MIEKIIELSKNGSHVSNPYHNVEHCIAVYEHCLSILHHEDVPMSNALRWASIFHDYDHSGGHMDEEYNIDVAMNWAHLYHHHHSLATTSGNDLYWAGLECAEIMNLIKCTAFIDGMFPHEPKNIYQMAIRDADLMTMFLPDQEAIKSLNGLYQEILVNCPSLTKVDFWNKNINFMVSATWYTEYGKMLAETIPDRLEELRPLFLEE